MTDEEYRQQWLEKRWKKSRDEKAKRELRWFRQYEIARFFCYPIALFAFVL